MHVFKFKLSGRNFYQELTFMRVFGGRAVIWLAHGACTKRKEFAGLRQTEIKMGMLEF
jgi:hypothetical protein